MNRLSWRRVQSPRAEPLLGFEELDVDELADAMWRSPSLDVRDRVYRFSTYESCFVAERAVDWLVAQLAPQLDKMGVRSWKERRKLAVKVGQTLLMRGYFHHVVDEHNFKDAFLFFRFYRDDDAVGGCLAHRWTDLLRHEHIHDLAVAMRQGLDVRDRMYHFRTVSLSSSPAACLAKPFGPLALLLLPVQTVGLV